MKDQLQEKLYKDFPLLYRNHKLTTKESPMGRGISTSNGWFELIKELSSKLEPLIQNQLDNDAHPYICFCGCPRYKHGHIADDTFHTGACTHVFKPAYKIPNYGFVVPNSKFLYTYRNTRQKIKTKINNFLKYISPVVYNAAPCKCEKYEQKHAAVLQVKQKYGHLCFYMSDATDEIQKIVSEYEAKGITTCESCGNPGILREGRWRFVECDTCYSKRSKQGVYDEHRIS